MRNKYGVFVFYLVVLVLAFGAFALIDSWGSQMNNISKITAAQGSFGHHQVNHLLHILLALSVVIIVARVIGAAFQYIHQPEVIGEVVGGILLGPSFLGWFAPDLYRMVLPEEAAPFLGLIAQLGVIFYMFVVGLEMDTKVVLQSGHRTLAISHASIVFPFLLGSGLALFIYRDLAPPEISFTTFSLFLGVSMSVTAFPVLARILSDRKINRTSLGALALTCAAVDDVTAWCLLAVAVSVAQAQVGGAIITLLMTIIYIVLMLVFGAPLIRKSMPLLEKFDQLTEGGMAIIFVCLLMSAFATELIGIHAIFGAFLLGAVVPHNSSITKQLGSRIIDLVKIIFLPVFFAFTGMRTQFGLLNEPSDWYLCGWIILLATAGKFGGTMLAARFTGYNWRNSAALGVLMNTRGLVGLIVLNIGLDLRIITPNLFTMLVLMSLVTTVATPPLFYLITRKHPWDREQSDAKAR